MSRERILITGAGGQLGSDLREQLDGRADVRRFTHAELDVGNDPAVVAAIADFKPDTVFNCAAYHNVELCETTEDRAFHINGTAVKRMAQVCAEHGARLVHMSTNYVFDGRRPEPYGEDDLPSPRSAYAISKLAGERAAIAYCPGALVVRGAGLYGLFGSGQKGGNFVTRVLERARGGEEMRIVSDQRLQPTFTRDLATALIEAVETGAEGIVHLTAAGECSWLEFTQAIFEIARLGVDIQPMTTSGGVDRPLNGVLARPRADALGLTPMRHWRVALADYMERRGDVA
jgi:dTDP-4-dehydrorhamnose reductase